MSNVVSVESLLAAVRRKGVRLWNDEGRLRYRAPKGALTREEIEHLAARSSEVLTFLGRGPADSSSPSSAQGPVRERNAPLTFSQLAHWQLYGLRTQPTIRHIAGARRIHGLLSLPALQQSIAEVVRRHEALRTRIGVVDGAPMQEVYSENHYQMPVDDLCGVAAGQRETETRQRIDRLIHEPICLCGDPLFAARLLRFHEHEHVLIVVMEHAISDMASVAIFFREVFEAYPQSFRGQPISLPAVKAQFADYAIAQWRDHRRWVEEHGRYWSEHLRNCGRLRCPADAGAAHPDAAGWGMVPVKIDRHLKGRLKEWCRAKHTTLVLTMLTTYMASLSAWCRNSDVVVQYAIDGRTNGDIEGAIGFFASVLYLRVQVHGHDGFVDLLKTVTEEYCRAYEHADAYYLATQVPRPEFTRTTMFNFVPHRGRQQPLPENVGESITCEVVPCSDVMLRSLDLDYEPMMVLFETQDEIMGGLHFSRQRFSVATMEWFAQLFLSSLEKVVLEEPLNHRSTPEKVHAGTIQRAVHGTSSAASAQL
jgi:hypothetical protein